MITNTTTTISNLHFDLKLEPIGCQSKGVTREKDIIEEEDSDRRRSRISVKF